MKNKKRKLYFLEWFKIKKDNNDNPNSSKMTNKQAQRTVRLDGHWGPRPGKLRWCSNITVPDWGLYMPGEGNPIL